jgi:hypothetical protein
MKFSLGADPELFMKDANDAFFSAIGIVGGTKMMPRKLDGLPDGFAVQEDNVAVEYNIPPSATKDQFIQNIGQAMSYLSDEVSKRGLYFVNVSATNEFPDWQLDMPAAKVFGCDPDYNAWDNGRRNPRPKATDAALRTCGGHVHIGGISLDKRSIIHFMKHMDLFAGVPSVLMDKGELRKQLYGKAGAYRLKPYGGEYRSLSNFWVFDPKLCEWVWNATDMAVNAWQDGSVAIDQDGPMILEAINNNNKDIAMHLVHKYNLLVV